jgi:Uma2 family endonuclease
VTALHQDQHHLLTIAEYEQLPEDSDHRWELQEGMLVMCPSPTSSHMMASGQLLVQLTPQLPADFCAIIDIDLDLELSPPGGPGHVRRPDLIVVEKSAYKRSVDEGKILRASEVLIVVEIVSPGSKRMDNVTKRNEYADASIPHYWIIEVDEPVSLIDCHLAGEFGYQDGGSITGEFATTAPFPIKLELDTLVWPR